MQPFRSEAEQLRELTRRAEEAGVVLREEKADLERRVGLQHRPRVWAAGVLVATLLTSIAGYTSGAFTSSLEIDRERMLRAKELALTVEEERSKEFLCEKRQRITLDELDTCRRDVTSRGEAWTLLTRPSGCPCRLNDTSCECPFDRAAAAAALSAAQSPILRCVQARRTGTDFHAMATFSPDGRVSSVELDSGAEQLGAMEKRCVLGAIRAARVPAFSGSTVITVGKTYAVERL